MRKKNLFIIISILAGIVAFWIIYKQIPFAEVLESFQSSSIRLVVSYIFISIAIMVALTWRWKIVLRSQGIELPFMNLFNYRIIGYGISYITPAAKLGGEPVRAALLTRHDIDFPKALSSIVIDKTIEISSNTFFFFIGVMTLLFNLALPGQAGTLMLIFALVSITTVVIFYQRMMSGKGVVKHVVKFLRIDKIRSLKLSEEKIEDFEKLLIKFFKEDRSDFVIALTISLLSWILMFLEFKFALLILGFDLSFISIFLIISFVGAAVMVPVPMAIGALEASQIAIFTILNIKSSAGVALSLIVRARDLIWTVIGMILLSYYGLKISNTLKKEYIKK